jgi:hypothetical protein
MQLDSRTVDGRSSDDRRDGKEIECQAAGADVVTIHSSPSPGLGDGLAARIVALTIERFRARSNSNGTKSAAIDAAISALRDPNRRFTGPTQWIVRARPMNRHRLR